MGSADSEKNGYIRQVDREEGYAMLDHLTRKHMQMSAREFIERWEAGQFRDEDEFPEATQLSMMIPLAK